MWTPRVGGAGVGRHCGYPSAGELSFSRERERVLRARALHISENRKEPPGVSGRARIRFRITRSWPESANLISYRRRTERALDEGRAKKSTRTVWKCNVIWESRTAARSFLSVWPGIICGPCVRDFSVQRQRRKPTVLLASSLLALLEFVLDLLSLLAARSRQERKSFQVCGR